VQYVSDGLQAELTVEITVHKDIARCITDWMYYACILTVETFQTEVKRALDRYKTTLHQAKMDRADFNFCK
jgi:hypothetical protein